MRSSRSWRCSVLHVMYDKYFWCSGCKRWIPWKAVNRHKAPTCPECRRKLRTKPRKKHDWILLRTIYIDDYVGEENGGEKEAALY